MNIQKKKHSSVSDDVWPINIKNYTWAAFSLHNIFISFKINKTAWNIFHFSSFHSCILSHSTFDNIFDYKAQSNRERNITLTIHSEVFPFEYYAPNNKHLERYAIECMCVHVSARGMLVQCTYVHERNKYINKQTKKQIVSSTRSHFERNV